MVPVPLSRRQVLLGAAGLTLAGCATAERAGPLSDGQQATGPDPAAAPADPAPTSTTAAAGLARFVAQGPGDAQAVALTFHGSGDPALVLRLLDAARAEQCPVTVFAVGRWLAANPAVATRILDDGHELANHTFTHPSLGRSTGPEVTREIDGCRDALVRLTGGPSRWFRPSGVEARPSDLILTRAALAGYATVVGFDVDPMDYTDPGASAVATRTSAGLHPGAIVSLHTGHAGTVAAFVPIASAIRARNLRPVTITNLLANDLLAAGAVGP